MLERIYARSFSVLSKIFSFPEKKEPLPVKRVLKPSPVKKEKVKREKPKSKSRKVPIFEVLATKSVEEIAKDIANARDKAYDREPLSSYEKFLFNAFMDMGNSTIEDLAKSLKAKAKRYGV